jgi:hypothetical protein
MMYSTVHTWFPVMLLLLTHGMLVVTGTYALHVSPLSYYGSLSILVCQAGQSEVWLDCAAPGLPWCTKFVTPLVGLSVWSV